MDSSALLNEELPSSQNIEQRFGLFRISQEGGGQCSLEVRNLSAPFSMR